MTERIAIVGASVRAAAASAVRAGFEVVAADLFADEDLCHIAAATQIHNYPFGLVGWLQALSPTPEAWLYTGALENHPDLVDQMAAIAPLWGNSGEILRQVRSPWRLADALRQAGVPFPEMRESHAGLPRDGTWLAKTGRGASGSGIAILDDFHDRPEHFYQRRVSGIPCSAIYVASAGKSELLGIVRQFIGEPWLHARPFQYCGAVGPWPVSDAARAEIHRIGGMLTNHFGVRGLFGVDFVLDGECVWTIEVNPRYTASIEVIERATGLKSIAAHAADCKSSTLTSSFPATRGAIHGKAYLFASRALHVTNQFCAEHKAVIAPLTMSWPALGDVPRADTHIESGRPVLTLFADGVTPNEVVANLKARVAIVERQLYAH